MNRSKSYILLSVLLLSFVSSGCVDVLNKKDLSSITEEQVWNSPSYSQGFLDNLCKTIVPGRDIDRANDSDEAGAGSSFLYGQLTSNSWGYWLYDKIRDVNTCIQMIGSGNLDVSLQAKIKAQALVLRAWLYFSMVRLYGGVPLILRPYEIGEDLFVPRNKTSECIEQIIKDLDEAINIPELPYRWEGNDQGRISKAVALALKGRVLLYYASPQFNVPGTKDGQRWQKAYEANKQAKERLAENGYGLFESFSDLWFEEMNKEVVFVRRYNYPQQTQNWSSAFRPLYTTANVANKNNPTQEMVDIFPMKNGIAITDPSSNYDPIHFWRNRDPRFAATIAYNSCIWPISENGEKPERAQWTYRGGEGNSSTGTGYYCRKTVDVTQTGFSAQNSGTDWIEIRYAEVLLNFAECAAETGHSSEAIETLKIIRNRAGIEAGSNGMYGLKEDLSGESLVKAVLLERRLELAFEGHRFWDLRRRKLFETELNGTRRHRLIPELYTLSHTDFNAIRDNLAEHGIDIENNYSDYFTATLDDYDTEDIKVKPEYDFFAIENSHLERDSTLKQTQGWPEYQGRGWFNPYE